MNNFKKLILQRLINHMHFHTVSKYLSGYIPSLFLSILIGNLAILKLIIQDSVQLPDFLTIFTNPVIIEQNSSSMCIQKYIELNYSYWINYFKLAMPILIFNSFTLMMALFLRRQNNIKSYFLFPLIQLFLSQGPTLIVLYILYYIRFIKQTLYITYSNIKYTSFDQSIRYYSRLHKNNLQLIIPIILILLIIFPVMLMLLIRKQARHIFKDKFIQLGNFIIPFKSNYQELVNYFRSSIVMLLLTLDDKQLTFQNKTVIITIIMFINFKFEIYKIKLIQLRATQSGIHLVIILYLANFLKQMTFLSQCPLIMIMTVSFIIQEVQQYIRLIYKFNKLQILEFITKSKFLNKYFNYKNYLHCLRKWKSIKQNIKIIGQKNDDDIIFYDIITCTLQTIVNDNDNSQNEREIEMIQL